MPQCTGTCCLHGLLVFGKYRLRLCPVKGPGVRLATQTRCESLDYTAAAGTDVKIHIVYLLRRISDDRLLATFLHCRESSSYYCRSVLLESNLLSHNTYSGRVRRQHHQSWHRMSTFRISGPLKKLFSQQVEQQTIKRCSHALGQVLTSNTSHRPTDHPQTVNVFLSHAHCLSYIT